MSSSAFVPLPFKPAPGTSNRHVQTLTARLLRGATEPPMIRERWETPDGDFLDVDMGPVPTPNAPMVLILHGLEGSSERAYVRSACAALVERGLQPVALNFRGCSGEPNRRPRLYHSGETTDPAFVLEGLRGGFPGRKFGALGFSLGGNVLLKLLGERADGGAGLVDAAVAVSVPYDLAAGGAELERTFMGRLYEAYFLRSLRRKVRAKAEALSRFIDVPATLRARTLRAFDNAATAPLHGFADADDYYARCSSSGYVAGIRVPTLLLHSRDDPFLPEDAAPVAAAEGNPALTWALTDRGGHVGFMGGSALRPSFWAESEAARFLGSMLASPR